MAGIFISYRRDDAAADAGRLQDDLRRRCARGEVFLDVSIQAGTDFREALAAELDTCEVLIAVIGPRWLDARNQSTGQRRLDEEADYVRLEIATALAKRKVVVPVLLPGAKMPRPEDLPESIRELAWRNAFELRYDRWSVDTDQLVKQLPSEVGCTPGATGSRSWQMWGYVVFAPVVLLVALHLFAIYNLPIDPHYLAAGASFVVGAVTSIQFRFAMLERLSIALAVSILTGILTSIFVAMLSGQNVTPRDLVEIRLFVTFVASVLVGYLLGAHAIDLLHRRRQLQKGDSDG
jgi:hypothetical protein